MDSLELQFGACSKPLMLRSSMLDRKQRPGESVASYTDALLAIFRELQITDEIQILTTYVSNLLPDLKAHVQRGLPRDLQHAQHLAQVAEASSPFDATKGLDHLTQLMAQMDAKLSSHIAAAPATLAQLDRPSRGGFPNSSRGRGRNSYHNRQRRYSCTQARRQ